MIRSPQNGITDFVICLRNGSSNGAAAGSEDVPMGKIGIYSPRPSNEIGFLLARQHWHKGYAREALALILEHLFNLEQDTVLEETEVESGEAPTAERPSNYTALSDLEQQSKWLYPSVTADTDPRNAASIGVLKRLGFKESGFAKDSFEIDGSWVDSQYLKLTRSEWLASKS